MKGTKASFVIGLLMIAVGLVWFAQGIGRLAGSPMTGVGFWAIMGVVSFVLGWLLVLRSRRPGTPAPPASPRDK